nr:MAG TPA: hypothetical protein [Caudoviricetes sp.]
MSKNTLKKLKLEPMVRLLTTKSYYRRILNCTMPQ